MDYFTVCLNGLCLAVQSAMHLFFVSRFTGKKEKLWHFAAYLFLLFALEWIAGRLSIFWVAVIGAELLILYGMNRLALGNRRSVSWTASILAVSVLQLSSGIVNSAEALLFPHFIGRPLLYLLVLLAVASAFGISAVCYITILKLVSLENDCQASALGLLLFPVMFFFTAELYIVQTSYTQFSSTLSLSESGKHFALLFLQSLGLGALFCTLYAYRRICHGFQAQTILASLAQAAQAQKVYISEAQIRYEQTKAFRHDIRNHLTILSGLLNSGKSKEAKDYLQKLEITSASLSFSYQTGNPVVDILLSEKMGLAQAKEIAVEISLVLPTPCMIDDLDLCIIFANALDNAVSACQSTGGTMSICISGKRQGDFYLLEFDNTCQKGPLPPMGTGLSNIKAVAEKYHGAVLTEKKEQHFSLNVLLNISLHPGNISIQKP